jgi:uncharacterized surface protein with fasciclin (FAS1) repeats
MRKSALAIGVAAAVLAIGACGKEQGSPGGNGATTSAEGGDAGGKTIAAGIGENSKFAAAAKAAGLDATLAGPGPYTVLVPADEAFNKLPNGQYDSWTKPEGRAQLTGVLTYHILPGTVLAEDIGKAIDNAKGKAVLATMGGGTLTATREGGNVVLTDGAGNKATVTRGDQKYSNGVVHQIDGVLMPQQQQQAG